MLYVGRMGWMGWYGYIDHRCSKSTFSANKDSLEYNIIFCRVPMEMVRGCTVAANKGSVQTSGLAWTRSSRGSRPWSGTRWVERRARRCLRRPSGPGEGGSQSLILKKNFKNCDLLYPTPSSLPPTFSIWSDLKKKRETTFYRIPGFPGHYDDTHNITMIWSKPL